MAELIIACRDSVQRAVRAQVLAAWLALAGIGLAQAAAPEPSASAPVAPSAAPTSSVHVAAPRITGRLRAADSGLVINTALDWIVSGATANHGAVSEPCNHAQKFPHPQVLLLHYLQGSTATLKPCSGL